MERSLLRGAPHPSKERTLRLPKAGWGNSLEVTWAPFGKPLGAKNARLRARALEGTAPGSFPNKLWETVRMRPGLCRASAKHKGRVPVEEPGPRAREAAVV